MAQEFSDEVLEETPGRATDLLTGMGADAAIRTIMFEQGHMGDDEIVLGRSLLLACLAAPAPKGATDTEAAKRQRAAAAELDSLDERCFARVGSALERHHPSVNDYVFHHLEASTGMDAVKGWATFLSRVDALENGTDPDRQDPAVRADDQAAVALLAKRGMDTAERTRLWALVNVALGPTAIAAPPNNQARRDALLALRLWYNEWAETARSVLEKKSHRIRVGIATRSAPKKKEEAAKEAAAKEAAAKEAAAKEAAAKEAAAKNGAAAKDATKDGAAAKDAAAKDAKAPEPK